MVQVAVQNVISLLFPSLLKRPLLRLLGHDIGKGVKIGCVYIGKHCKLRLDKGTKVGNFNFFRCGVVSLSPYSRIGSLNLFRGYFSVSLNTSSAIGNLNRFINGGFDYTTKSSSLAVGEYANITSGHYLDVTCDISIEENSVVGGTGSQLWTHGFKHFAKGVRRVRIDGPIKIGAGVYVGSRVVINPGITVCDEASIGAGAVVSRSLKAPDMYVSQSLREVEQVEENFFERYKEVNTQKPLLQGLVYEKRQ